MNNFLDDSFVDKIKNNCDIVNVISHYIPLQKKGTKLFACCPFHLEKTPSFSVNPEDGYYHCYGCNDSGDVIKFVRKYENCDFVKALEILAKQAGIEMPETVYNAEISKQKQKKEKILEINKVAAKIYNAKLFEPIGKTAYDYLLSRGLTRETIIKFGIGLSPDWDSVVKSLKEKGYSQTELIDSGVCGFKNGRLFDFYGERIIFPIINTYDEVVGFSARTMKKDADLAKYKNTQANMVFEKSRILYGINNIKKLKNSEPFNEIILVEGQMDIIKLYQSGIKNVVASMGTALTVLHAKELKRFTDKVIVCFDGDGAGQKAAIKSIEVLHSAGLDVRVMTIPNKLDPDDYVTKFGVERFYELIKESKNAVEFKLEITASKFDLKDNYAKSKFIKEAIKILKAEENEIDSEIYLKYLSKLCDVQIDLLRRSLRNESVELTEKKEEIEKPSFVADAYVTARKFVLASLLHKRPYAKTPDNIYFKFTDIDLDKLFEYIKDGKRIGDLYTLFNEEEQPAIFEIVCYNFSAFENEKDEERFYNGSIKQIILKNLELKKNEINEKIKNEISIENKKKYLLEMKNVLDEIGKLKLEESNG